MTPEISIVIPTMGRPILVQTLKSVLTMKHSDRLEVIVVGEIYDSGVLQSVNEIVAGDFNVRHISVSYKTGDSSRKKIAVRKKVRRTLLRFWMTM